MSPLSSGRILHYIPPAKDFEKVVHEFVEPNPSDHFIHFLFRYRCMICKTSKQTEINEIIPRGRSKKSIMDWRNRVVLCRTHHEEFHHGGVTNDKIKDMQEKRKEYLISIDRGQYL